VPKKQQPSKEEESGGRYLQIKRVIWPLLFGLIATVYIFYKTFNIHDLSKINWSWTFVGILALAFICCLLRDGAYIWRMRILTDQKLSWKKCFQIIMLWEFSSSVTPGAAGGSVAAIYMLKKEGFSLGKSSAMILITAMFDELVFIIAVPILYLLLGNSMFQFDASCEESKKIAATGFMHYADILVWVVYFALLLLYILLFYGIFINPHTIRNIYIGLGKLPIIKRWQASLNKAGDDMIIASQEYRGKPFSFWLKNFVATSITWNARYLLSFFVVWAFADHIPPLLVIYGRQYFIRTINILPLSPGGAGLAELSFLAFLCEFITGGLSATAMLVWRIFSYYLYLLVGVIVLPQWWAQHRR
jgi:hypothetical protein